MLQAPLPPLSPHPMEIAVAVVTILGTAGTMAILWLLVRGWVQRWNAPRAIPTGAQPVLDDLKHSVAQLSAEVAELHERMDFTERVLAQRDEGRELGGGH